MGYYSEKILPRIVDRLLTGHEVHELRRKCLAGVNGTVLEMGFGSGLNLPFYPKEVTRLLAFDPARFGRKLASGRIAETPFPVEFVDLSGEKLQVPDESVDYVVSTWTLCTIPDLDKILAEIERVLKPSGRLHFMEHGRSDDPSVSRWQARLNPIQKFLGGGCHLDRRIDSYIHSSPLELTELEKFYKSGARIGNYMYSGVAEKNKRG
jgi:ubiquinone/menaquinone biosynthesis C-methylase UbiE